MQASLKAATRTNPGGRFRPCSYGFRLGRRRQDAVEEIRFYAARGHEHVFEGDIAARFDEISHPALMDRLRRKVSRPCGSPRNASRCQLCVAGLVAGGRQSHVVMAS